MPLRHGSEVLSSGAKRAGPALHANLSHVADPIARHSILLCLIQFTFENYTGVRRRDSSLLADSELINVPSVRPLENAAMPNIARRKIPAPRDLT